MIPNDGDRVGQEENAFSIKSSPDCIYLITFVYCAIKIINNNKMKSVNDCRRKCYARRSNKL